MAEENNEDFDDEGPESLRSPELFEERSKIWNALFEELNDFTQREAPDRFIPNPYILPEDSRDIIVGSIDGEEFALADGLQTDFTDLDSYCRREMNEEPETEMETENTLYEWTALDACALLESLEASEAETATETIRSSINDSKEPMLLYSTTASKNVPADQVTVPHKTTPLEVCVRIKRLKDIEIKAASEAIPAPREAIPAPREAIPAARKKRRKKLRRR